MKQILFILGCFLLLYSCEDTTGYKKPDKLISEKEMANILYDIHLYQSVYNNKKYGNDSLWFDDKDLHFSILKKHGIEDTLFIESIIYYSGYPKAYERIYKEVIDRLVMQEQEFSEKDAVKIHPDKPIL